jgi:hypothetical protein
MSAILNWQEARDAILSGDNFGYGDAIEYYNRLK